MALTAVVLVIVSAFLHAGWNLAGKRAHPSTAFFLVANLVGCLCLVPLLLTHMRVISVFPARVWVLLALTGLCQAAYFAALAGAYRTGDLSVAYPLARSSPVIVVTIATVLLGRGDEVGGRCVLGILLVVAGCFLVPMRRFRDLRLGNYVNVSCLLGLCAAFGTAGYSMLDDEALRLLRGTPGVATGNTMTTLLYAGLEAISVLFWLALFVLPSRGQRAVLCETLRERALLAAGTGLTIYAAYTLVLVAMAFVANVSYVVAFRQLSVPLGAVLGVLVLKEPGSVPKFVGVGVMFVGLVLVGTG